MYYLVWKNMMPFTIGLHSLYVKKVVNTSKYAFSHYYTKIKVDYFDSLLCIMS